MSDALVYEAPAGIGIEGLEDALLDAFRAVRDAVSAGRPVVVIVRDADVLGHGEPADAALANALVGLVRAFATEGGRDGWRVNALSVPDGDERAAWVDRLADPQGVSGAIVRLGDLHLGRVPA